MIVNEQRKIAYNYILNQGYGVRQAVIEMIGENMFHELCIIGFIKEGVDGEGEERWQLSEFGQSQMIAYLELLNK